MSATSRRRPRWASRRNRDGAPFWSRANRSPAKRANTRWPRPAFLKAVRKAMKRFERAAQAGLQRREPPPGHGRAGRRRAGRLSDRGRADAGARIPRHQAARRVLPRVQRLERRLLLQGAQARALGGDPADAGCRGSRSKRRIARRKNGAISFYIRPNPVRGRTIFSEEYLPLWREVEKLGRPISTHESASASVPSFGDRMDTHVSGHILSHPFEAMAAMAGLIWYGVFEKFPKLQSRPRRGRRRLGSLLAAADGAALELQRQLRARVSDPASDRVFQVQLLRRVPWRRAHHEGRDRSRRRRQLPVGHRLSASRRHLPMGHRRDA